MKTAERITAENFYNNGSNSKLTIQIDNKRTLSANVLKSDLPALISGKSLTEKYFTLENGKYKYSNPCK